jgi:hypothetical protein
VYFDGLTFQGPIDADTGTLVRVFDGVVTFANCEFKNTSTTLTADMTVGRALTLAVQAKVFATNVVASAFKWLFFFTGSGAQLKAEYSSTGTATTTGFVTYLANRDTGVVLDSLPKSNLSYKTLFDFGLAASADNAVTANQAPRLYSFSADSTIQCLVIDLGNLADYDSPVAKLPFRLRYTETYYRDVHLTDHTYEGYFSTETAQTTFNYTAGGIGPIVVMNTYQDATTGNYCMVIRRNAYIDADIRLELAIWFGEEGYRGQYLSPTVRKATSLPTGTLVARTNIGQKPWQGLIYGGPSGFAYQKLGTLQVTQYAAAKLCGQVSGAGNRLGFFVISVYQSGSTATASTLVMESSCIGNFVQGAMDGKVLVVDEGVSGFISIYYYGASFPVFKVDTKGAGELGTFLYNESPGYSTALPAGATIIKASVFKFLSLDKVVLDDWETVPVTVNSNISSANFILSWSSTRKALWFYISSIVIKVFTIGQSLGTFTLPASWVPLSIARDLWLPCFYNTATTATTGRRSMLLSIGIPTSGVCGLYPYPMDAGAGAGARSEYDGGTLFGDGILYYR